ncbi:MAG: fatty acid desaturase [Pseudomonadales bacterium]|nr:fatty acid desaturase [Pseudomonadales bacterium]
MNAVTSLSPAEAISSAHAKDQSLTEQAFIRLDEEQLAAFGAEIAAVGEKIRADLGNDEDERYLRRLNWSNISCETVGRALIHFSFEPITFILGVILLSLHFNFEVTFAHNCGHGAFNRLRNKKGLGKFNTKEYLAKKLPASIEGWKYSHNRLHHVNCNIVGKDPDVGYEAFRVTDLQGKPTWYHKIQLVTLALMSTVTFLVMGFRTYQFEDQKKINGVFVDQSLKTYPGIFLRLLSKNRYFFFNLLLFPAIAGLCFLSAAQAAKVLLANLLAEAIRGLSYGTMFHMGHHTGTVKFYPKETKPANKAEWYVLQIETSHSVIMNAPFKHVFGGLDLQIEHHIFPDLPANKLHQIQPEIEAICAKYNIQYSKASYFKSAWLCMKNYTRKSF